jgi:transcriptional regulator with XRE-family HTH domain
MDVKEIFKRRLLFLHKESGLSQSEFGIRCGVTRGSVWHYENGDRVPDGEFVANCSRAFGVSVDYLLGLSDEKTTPDTDVKSVCAALHLSEKAVNVLLSAHPANENIFAVDGDRGFICADDRDTQNELLESYFYRLDNWFRYLVSNVLGGLTKANILKHGKTYRTANRTHAKARQIRT